MPDPQSSEQRLAQALDAAAAYRRRRTQGHAESLEALLAAHMDLRDLLEPMLSEPDGPGPTAPEPCPQGSDRFAHFDLLEVLGRGGMGEVYLARDRRLQRSVALKMIRPAALGSPASRERFRREARVVARLDHAHICKLYDADEHEGRPYLALQHLEGETLAARIASRRAAALARGAKTTLGPRTREEIAETIAMLEKVARAVHHAHEQGVIHRDLKPGNIMITKGEEPVVLDFGLARDERSLDHSQSCAARPAGTPLYMAPEQIEHGRVDRHTDVYALGVILYECLTLALPFEGQSERELQDRILGSEPVPVARRNRAVPHDLAVVVDKAMAKQASRRYRTALLLAEDLARVRALEPVLARSVSALGRVERWTRRNPLVALLLWTLTAGLGMSLWQYRRAETNLDRFLQMRDLPIVQDLVREAEVDLWPAHPDKLERLGRWLERARGVEARLPGHRAALAELRRRALPLSPELQREEQALGKLRQELVDLRAQHAAKPAAEHGTAQPQDPAQAIARLEGRIAQRAQSFERQRWQFAAIEDRFVHEPLAQLVQASEALVDPTGGHLSSVAARQQTAATLAERSVGDEQGSAAARHLAAAWREAAQRVARQASFAGFALRPQMGLVPLGPDPESQLEEFAHLLSGEPAARDAQGKLVIGARTGIVLVLIPGGTFPMGAQAGDPSGTNYDPMAQKNESPVHEVTLDPYLLAKHEVTQGQWLSITGTTPSMFSHGPEHVDEATSRRHPVENVSWTECEKALRQVGLVLPTEAQWERAARAGTMTPWWTGCEKSSILGAANVADRAFHAQGGMPNYAYDADLADGQSMHAPIGSSRPNPFGLWDMIGNVAEWCTDTYGGYDREVIASDGSRRAALTACRVVRGGSWAEVAAMSRAAWRIWYRPDLRYFCLGCRPARDLER